MKFRKLLVYCLTVTLFVLGTFSVQASAMTGEELEEQFETALESVDSYIEWIKKQIENGEATSEQLDSFQSLSYEEQDAFIEILKNQDTYFAPLEELDESDEQFGTQSFSASTTSDEVDSTTTIELEVEGVTLPLTVEYGEVETEQPSFTTLSSKTRTVTSYYKLSLGKTTITSFTTWVRYEHGTTRATKYLTGNHSHTNLNPGMIISKDGGGGYLSGGYANYWGAFIMRGTASLGFINDNATHYVKGNAKERWHRFTTTHPKMPGYAWHKF